MNITRYLPKNLFEKKTVFITGGGSGGTVAVLGDRDVETAVKKVAERYAALMGYEPYIFRGSSPGSAAFGYLIVRIM